MMTSNKKVMARLSACGACRRCPDWSLKVYNENASCPLSRWCKVVGKRNSLSESRITVCEKCSFYENGKCTILCGDSWSLWLAGTCVTIPKNRRSGSVDQIANDPRCRLARSGGKISLKKRR